MVQSSTREPLLRESERDAVSNLLRYLELGKCKVVAEWIRGVFC